MKLVSIILTGLPLATSSSSHATNIRGGRNNNRELWQWGGGRNNNNSNNQWGNDGYDSSSTSNNDGYSYPSSSGSHHSSSTPKPKPKPPPPKPKPAPKPAPKSKGHSPSKPTSSSGHGSTPSGYSTNKPYNSDKPTWYDDEWGDFYEEVSGYRQSSLISSKLAHYRDNSSRGMKVGLVSSLFALVALASLLVAKKIRRNRRKIPTIDANALSVDADDTSSNDSRGEEEEESVDYERTMAQITAYVEKSQITAYVEKYVEMTDQQRRQQQRQQQSSLGIPPRPSRSDRYRSKLMGKGNFTPASRKDASRLSVGFLG